ncbi:uncharacterized protein LOC123673370 [Harmonia axyridis]|uniref:uncharacterized protein LOC123673370 n=1 Tax=Harmonia axyridis TaxID=115357 RepID=UPI001E277B58|nr:uncharacterized protein LOC123673370 [Harmonia axyridis]
MIRRIIIITGLFIDFSKAFDCVNHDDLVKKLNFYGIWDKQLNFMRSYLRDRRQRVSLKIKGVEYLSLDAEVNVGIFGPFLFLIYINDLPDMVISASKTKSLTTSKIPIRCKLAVDDKIIQQEMKFKYLGIELSGYGDIELEVRQQTNKALRVAGCLNDTIWKNKYLHTETKARIYKSVIRPIMTYTAETRPDTAKTKRILEVGEMKILRKIAGKTLFDRERSDNVRRTCGVDNISNWVLARKMEWNDHISRMDQRRIVRIARDESPIGRRSLGRPRKRWSDNLTVH